MLMLYYRFFVFLCSILFVFVVLVLLVIGLV